MVSATPIGGGATLLAVTALYPKASGKICVKHMNSKNLSSGVLLIAVRPLSTFKRISKCLEIAQGLMFMFSGPPPNLAKDKSDENVQIASRRFGNIIRNHP
jgi:hypothetical protein